MAHELSLVEGCTEITCRAKLNHLSSDLRLDIFVYDNVCSMCEFRDEDFIHSWSSLIRSRSFSVKV